MHILFNLRYFSICSPDIRIKLSFLSNGTGGRSPKGTFQCHHLKILAMTRHRIDMPAKIPTNVQCCPLSSITGPADHANNSNGVLSGPSSSQNILSCCLSCCLLNMIICQQFFGYLIWRT